MNFDFSLILVIVSAVTGTIWLIDHFVFAKPRFNRLSQFLAERRVSNEDFQLYLNSLDKNSNPTKIAAESSKATQDTSKKTDPARKKILEQALVIYRDPVPVEYAKSLFPILFAVLILRSFLLEPFQIPSGFYDPYIECRRFYCCE